MLLLADKIDEIAPDDTEVVVVVLQLVVDCIWCRVEVKHTVLKFELVVVRITHGTELATDRDDVRVLVLGVAVKLMFTEDGTKGICLSVDTHKESTVLEIFICNRSLQHNGHVNGAMAWI